MAALGIACLPRQSGSMLHAQEQRPPFGRPMAVEKSQVGMKIPVDVMEVGYCRTEPHFGCWDGFAETINGIIGPLHWGASWLQQKYPTTMVSTI